jgi:hypothetical protein
MPRRIVPAVSRVLSTAFCVALLAAAAAAFALTEGAKTELSPIYATKILDKVFSPICDPHICSTRVAHLEFKLRAAQRLEVWMESASGTRVSTIVAGRTYPRGTVALVFDGRGAGGALLPDGFYLPVVRLVDAHRTITLIASPIQVDTRAPQVVHLRRGLRALLAPDSAGRPHLVLVAYTLSGPGHGILFVDGHRVSFTYRQRLHGVLQWNGTIDGRPVAAGGYTLEVAAQDEAGNRSKPVTVGRVSVRYLELGRTRIAVKRRARFSVGVVIGPARVSWLFDGQRGSASSHTIHLRAPRRKGSYRLFVSGAGHGASALVVVG